jgi:hypothetical protein
MHALGPVFKLPAEASEDRLVLEEGTGSLGALLIEEMEREGRLVY